MFETWDVIGWACVAVVVGVVLWNAQRQYLERRKIDKWTKTLDQWGYAAGRLGKPPDFYKTEDIGSRFDWVDELAVKQGWQRGFHEYLALNKKAEGL